MPKFSEVRRPETPERRARIDAIKECMVAAETLTAAVNGLVNHYMGGYECEWDCCNREIWRSPGESVMPNCRLDEPAHNDELVSRSEVLALIERLVTA